MDTCAEVTRDFSPGERLTLNCEIYAKYIVVHVIDATEATSLTLCEVEVIIDEGK